MADRTVNSFRQHAGFRKMSAFLQIKARRSTHLNKVNQEWAFDITKIIKQHHITMLNALLWSVSWKIYLQRYELDITSQRWLIKLQNECFETFTASPQFSMKFLRKLLPIVKFKIQMFMIRSLNFWESLACSTPLLKGCSGRSSNGIAFRIANHGFQLPSCWDGAASLHMVGCRKVTELAHQRC